RQRTPLHPRPEGLAGSAHAGGGHPPPGGTGMGGPDHRAGPGAGGPGRSARAGAGEAGRRGSEDAARRWRRRMKLEGLNTQMGLERGRTPLASRVVWAAALCLVSFAIWASIFELDEVTTGSGRVIPTSREQVIQSQEGGIVAMLRVREGDLVEAGQVLAHLDPTRWEATVEE